MSARPPLSRFAAIIVAAGAAFVASGTAATAQLSEEELRRERIETTEDFGRTERLTAAAVRARSDKRGWLFDYGFNAAYSFTASTDNDRNAKAQDDPDHTWNMDYNIYAVTESIARTTKFYFRLKNAYVDNAKISPATLESDVEQMKIDMFYFERKFTGKSANHRFTVGRQFTKVGRGIAYGQTADGIYWKTKGKKMSASALWMRKNPGDNNIDNLAPGSGRTKRWFMGAEYGHSFKQWFAVTTFALWNFDRNNEQAHAVAGIAGSIQRHRFDSQYYGIGFDGTVFSKLNYWSEYVMVRGKTYNASTIATPIASKVKVDADAIDVGLRYLFGGALAPTVFGEYAFGSGDADRVSNVTSSERGSTFGTDSVFRSFGGLTMGHALAPSLSNIRIAKFGVSAKPLGRLGAARWNDMTLNFTAYTYWTFAKGGATADPVSATGSNAKSKDLGDEYDMTLSWKVFNDVNYQLKYGVFAPGPAYVSARGHETYLKLKLAFDI